MTNRILLTRAEVCARLKQSEKWFTKYRLRLETQHGFPRALPPTFNRWDPKAIDLWLDRFIPQGSTRPSDVVTLTIDTDHLRTDLRERSRKIVAGMRR